MLEQHLLAYYIGIAIVIATHLYFIAKRPDMKNHALLNLGGAGLIAYYFMFREGKIGF